MNSEQKKPSTGRFSIWVFCAIPVVAAVLGVLNNLRVYEERRVAWPWEDVVPAPAAAPETPQAPAAEIPAETAPKAAPAAASAPVATKTGERSSTATLATTTSMTRLTA